VSRPGVLLFVAACAAVAAAAPRPPAAPIQLVDDTAASGVSFRSTYGTPGRSTYILETTGTGVALLDFDGDGVRDLFFANGSTLDAPGTGAAPRSALFRGRGDGTFTDVTDKAGVGRSGWGQGVAVADYDNDGDADLFLTYFGPNVLFRNEGNGTFRDVTEAAGVAGGGWSTSAAFADYDRDGRLDLYVARYVDFDPATAPRPGSQRNCFYRGFPVMCGPRGLGGQRDRLYRNNGDGTFADVTVKAGDLDRAAHRGLGVVWGDYDNDGWPDVFVANDAHPNLLFHNQRDGTFREAAFEAGVAYDEDGRERAGMGTDFGDYDNDGWLDLVITNFYDEPHSLYLNQHDGTFEETTWPSGLGEATLRYLGWGTGFADLDNDGWKDLFFVNGHVYPEVDRHGLDETYAERNLVLRNQGDGRFTSLGPAAGAALERARVGRGAAFGDYDGDGRLDIVVTNVNDGATLLRNQSPAGHGWLAVELLGRQSNRDGIGARVTAQVGSRRLMQEIHGGASYLSQSDLRAHFGLGAVETVTELEVRWPSGTVDRMRDVRGRQVLTVEEGKGIVSKAGPTPARP
jgi:hypothetical protein